MKSGKAGKPGSTRVRSKVVVLLLSLTALWVFAAYVTLQEGTNLLSLSTLANRVALPGEEVTEALQAERLQSLLYVEDRSSERRAVLDDQRLRTGEAAQRLREGIDDSTVRLLASSDLEAKLADVKSQLDRLSGIRSEINAGTFSQAETMAAYTATIDALLRVNNSLVTLDDDTIALFGRTLNKITQTKEILRQEEAILASALASGQLTPADHTMFVQLVGTQRFLLSEAQAEFPYPEMTDQLRSLMAGPRWRDLALIEDAVIASGAPTELTLASWAATISPVIEQVREFLLDAKDVGLAKATPVAIGVIVRLALAGGLGLVAVIASIVISVTTARNLVRQLERLRNAARDLASYRLPRVVERLQHGEQVDVRQEAPPLDFGRDEIGQVGEAFNQVQETAIRVAVEQAELRRSVRDVFLSLARRSQALLHRQLGLLDSMERRTTDSEELAELFRIDHLATRMRRNAENLIVLSGATAGRAWRKPVPMVDVLRGALAEVEDYTRVTVLPVGNASLLGRAVGDVIHLLAELIENAVSFSPPQTTVRVGGSVVGYGFAIEIEDRGLGMSPEELVAANEQLRDPPEFRLTSTARLGLYVVAKLAERHGIRVRLTESPYGGTTAIVLLPGSIMAGGDAEEGPLDPSQLDSYRPAQLAGVGRHRLQSDADRTRSRSEAATAIAEAPVRADTPAELNGAGHDAPVLTEPRQNGHRQVLPPPTTTAPDLTTTPATTTPASTAPSVAAPASTAPSVAAPASIEPSTTEQAAPGASVTEQPALTPSGLPWRQRRPAQPEPTVTGPTVPTVASAPPAVGSTGGPPVTLAGPAAVDGAGLMPVAPRDPDATRTLMASYRSGTLRGRDDAARLIDTGETAGDEPTTRSVPAPAEPPAPTGTGADEYPQWTQATTESPQWTESAHEVRQTREGG